MVFYVAVRRCFQLWCRCPGVELRGLVVRPFGCCPEEAVQPEAADCLARQEMVSQRVLQCFSEVQTSAIIDTGVGDG